MHAGSVHAVLTLVKSASEAKGHARIATESEEKGGAPGGETRAPRAVARAIGGRSSATPLG
jgi:hypothetical protein